MKVRRLYRIADLGFLNRIGEADAIKLSPRGPRPAVVTPLETPPRPRRPHTGSTDASGIADILPVIVSLPRPQDLGAWGRCVRPASGDAVHDHRGFEATSARALGVYAGRDPASVDEREPGAAGRVAARPLGGKPPRAGAEPSRRRIAGGGYCGVARKRGSIISTRGLGAIPRGQPGTNPCSIITAKA